MQRYAFFYNKVKMSRCRNESKNRVGTIVLHPIVKNILLKTPQPLTVKFFIPIFDNKIIRKQWH